MPWISVRKLPLLARFVGLLDHLLEKAHLLPHGTPLADGADAVGVGELLKLCPHFSHTSDVAGVERHGQTVIEGLDLLPWPLLACGGSHRP